MNEEEKQELKNLLDIWKEKHKLINKENSKRFISLTATAVVDFVAVGLQFLNIIPFEVTFVVIISMFIIGITINHFIHQRIQKIIWEN